MEPAPHNRRPSPTRLSCVCFSRIVSQSAPAKCCPNPNPAAPQAPGGRLARGARGGGAALSVLGCRPPVSGHRGVAREGSWDGSEGFLRGVGGIAACFFIAVCRHCPCQLPRATSRRPSLPRFSATIPNESNELQRLCTFNEFLHKVLSRIRPLICLANTWPTLSGRCPGGLWSFLKLKFMLRVSEVA